MATPDGMCRKVKNNNIYCISATVQFSHSGTNKELPILILKKKGNILESTEWITMKRTEEGNKEVEWQKSPCCCILLLGGTYCNIDDIKQRQMSEH